MKQYVLCLVGSVGLLSACAGQQQLKPQTVSSADSASYAQRYPTVLESTRTRLAEEKTRAQTLSSGLAAQAKDLKPPFDGDLVLSIVDAADRAGKSEALAQAHSEERAVRDFWEEERGPIGSRVNSAVQQKATEAKCENTELTSSVPYALREGVDKQLEKRLRSHNEAHLIIERNKGPLGQANVTVLQKLVDDVAMNSYLVNIALIEDRNRIQQMLAERRTVARTLDDAIEEETRPPTTSQTPAERRASAERLSDLTKSRDALPSVATNAEGEIKASEEQVKAAQTEYESALSALRDEIKKLAAPR